MLYGSSTLALACLEVLVHIRDVGLIPTDYVYCEIEAPESLITPWDLTGEAALARIESPVLSREFGDAWIRFTEIKASPRALQAHLDLLTHALGEKREDLIAELERIRPVCAVPSVIIPREMNFLISPAHPQFDQLIWNEPEPFRFDPRLIQGAAE
jgi:hypothetical protein